MNKHFTEQLHKQQYETGSYLATKREIKNMKKHIAYLSRFIERLEIKMKRDEDFYNKLSEEITNYEDKIMGK